MRIYQNQNSVTKLKEREKVFNILNKKNLKDGPEIKDLAKGKINNMIKLNLHFPINCQSIFSWWRVANTALFDQVFDFTQEGEKIINDQL